MYSESAPLPPVLETTCEADAEVEYSEKIDCSKIGQLLCTKSVLLIFLQGVPGCLPWGMVYTFLNDYLSNERGMSVLGATIALSLFGAGGFVGQLLGGMTACIYCIYDYAHRGNILFMNTPPNLLRGCPVACRDVGAAAVQPQPALPVRAHGRVHRHGRLPHALRHQHR